MSLPTPIQGRCGVCDWPTNRLPCPYCEAAQRAATREALSARPHEFVEDVNDGSMCRCGIPALVHDDVFPPDETPLPRRQPTPTDNSEEQR